jgi:Reverse transcriptase (RNA-dependent DNA polymerase)
MTCINCVFVDASKAFGRVCFDELFHFLSNRNISVMFIRLLCSLYTFHIACFLWDGVYTNKLPIKNGVKQGVSSPVLFCKYIDGLLDKLADTFVGRLFYWHGIFLVRSLMPMVLYIVGSNPNCNRKRLSVCNEFANDLCML